MFAQPKNQQSQDTKPMTFLYDDIIIAKFEKVLEKQAQVQPVEAFNPRQLQDVALKLVSNLKQAYSPIQVEGTGQLAPSNLLNLDNLIDWMRDNGVKYNGKPIVVHTYVEANSQKEVPYIEYDAGRGGGPNAAGGQGGGRNPYVWKEGVIAFLEDLRKQASDSKNKLFVEQVSNVINQANKMQGLKLGLDEEQKEESDKKPAAEPTNQQAQKPSGQPGQQSSQFQQAAYQQAKEIIDTVQKASGGSSKPPMPFDLTTNQINVDLMRGFLRLMQELIEKPAFKVEMANYYNMFANNVQQTGMALDNFLANATPEAARGGFQLDPTNPDAFVNTFARSDQNPYAKARMMLNTLVPVFQGLANIVRGLQSSLILVDQFNETEISEQYSAGMRYMQYAQSMISRITSSLTSQKR
jgi:hypothetical protein